MKFQKRLFSLAVTAALMGGLVSGITACKTPIGGEIIENVDKNQTQLYVSNLNAGLGYQWLLKLIDRFESDFADVSFEEGKMGVQVIADTENQVNARWLILPTDTWNVYFNENLPYYDFVTQRLLLDISDVVKGNGYGEDKTIESKLDGDHQKGLTSFDGKYYALPHYEAYRGISYNVSVFDDNRLYFAENAENGNDGFIVRPTDKRSAGPNGIAGDSDDGLPSSLEEFVKLCDRMVLLGVTPFIWPGSAVAYTQYIVDAVASNIDGLEGTRVLNTYDSEGREIEVVTGFQGGEPTIEGKTIDNADGYLLQQTKGKYYGYWLLEKIVRNIDRYAYPLSNNNSTFTQLASQEEFINSMPENRPIGMIVDGNYWWNEAQKAYERAVASHGPSVQNLEFAWMPLPHRVSNSDPIPETKQTLTDVMQSYCFVNANIADDPVKVKLAKLFVSYAYSDVSLREFTVQTGVAKGLSYDLTEEDEAKLNSYCKSCWNMHVNDNIVRKVSANRMYIENQEALTYDLASSTVNGQSYLTAFAGFRAGVSAENYFKGTWFTLSDWNDKYSKYFG